MRILSRLRVAGIALALFGLSGCFYMMSGTISSTSGTVGPNTPVSAASSDWGILYLMIPNGLTTTANAQLVSQCPSGRISNVTTQLSVRDFFLAQMYTVSATGNCH
jgi:hypothetical protein